ncbi:homoserine kinase [Burkholderiales bacterium GJ-E10]|nr:homoserine kinase [Burkholderiales bacterium GJ-E10]
MAVFTDLSREDMLALLDRYALGALQRFQGIASGIENSNFFLTTDAGKYVLTVFERLRAEDLPFYLGLMRHLARHDLPVPEPVATRDGELFTRTHGKPVAIVARLSGKAIEMPDAAHCARVGETLARMHLAARDYPQTHPDPRGLAWWQQTVPSLATHMPAAQFQRLAEEIRFQERIASEPGYARLPSGPIHADLFRDNVLFDDDRIGGVIDFYFAGNGPWLYDLAVTMNDWCVDLHDGRLAPDRAAALLAAYHRVRPLQADERPFWQPMLRAAALRFWISRLYDLHLPRPAAVLAPHDPARFERTLHARADAAPEALPWV